MVNQNSLTVQSNFVAGYKTEYTGLNFPENAATATSNTIYTLTGDVLRRGGFNFETNFTTTTLNRTGKAISTYRWTNVGGDGNTQMQVMQVGSTLFFYKSSDATLASPLSTKLLVATVPFLSYLVAGSSADPSITECQFSDGNGFLFVFHPDCEPFYCTFTPGSPDAITSAAIDVKIRDFAGVYPEPGNPDISFRPPALNNEHNYNLQNQGWTSSPPWSATENNIENQNNTTFSIRISIGSLAFHGVQSGLSITTGDPVSITMEGSLAYQNGGVVYTQGYGVNGSGIVSAYVGTTLTINVQTTGVFNVPGDAGLIAINTANWTFSKNSSIANTISAWNSAIRNFPSNADVWFSFKNTSGVFSPSTTISNVAPSSTPAPRGHFILRAFNQDRSAVSGVPSITTVSTPKRPGVGTWFQGRVWYTGVNASQSASGDASYYTWTESIYFSQIIDSPTKFGYCYQQNDPSDENLFDLLPTDGGVLVIQGSGNIYKLVPVQNGLMVFAANGVWFITGSQGIGFTANDYTVTKIPNSPLVTSGTSFVNIQGWPVFWNEEGIYICTQGQQGGIQIQNACVGTILTYYSNIPLQSKKYARGDYSQVDYIVEWCFRSTNETSITERYQFDTVLAFNTINKAFYIYNLPAGTPYIHSVNYVAGPGGTTSPTPTFKYLTSYANAGSFKFTWSEEIDFTRYVDWFSFDSVGTNYTSTFTTAYKLEGKGVAKWQPTYVYVFLRNAVNNSYKIQGIWEFATSGASGKYSTVQVINDTTNTTNFGMLFHRHKVRGRGLVLQLKFASVDGKAFDIMGWTVWDNINQGP